MTDAAFRPSLAGPLAVALVVAAVWLQVVRETRYPLPVSTDESVYLTARAASRVVFAFRPLAADLYWIRAIRYYGGHKRRIEAELSAEPSPRPSVPFGPTLTYDQLYPLLDVTTTLDPQFNIAYRFGAIFLSEPYPAGADRPDQAIALLQKAMRVRPDRWQYLQDIGFVYYWTVHDYVAAARYFNAAADLPGAPWWMRSLAATMLARGGQRDASRLLWNQMYESATDDRQRDAAHLRLLQLDALDRIDTLQPIVDKFAKDTSKTPTSWQPLIGAGRLRGIPLDPSGAPYALVDGIVSVSQQSRLFPMPIEPAPRQQGS